MGAGHRGFITGWFTTGTGPPRSVYPTSPAWSRSGSEPETEPLRGRVDHRRGDQGSAYREPPGHVHGVAVANHAGHFHPIDSNTGSGGGHDNHIPAGNGYVLSNGSGAIAYVPGDTRQSVGNHTHGINTDTGTVNVSAHSVTETSVGSGTPFDVRQPSLALLWLVWT